MMERLYFEECKECLEWNGNRTHCANICMKPIEAMDEFNRYKDLEEQGLLLRLPCKVGDVVYAVYRTCKREDGVEIRCLYNENEPKCIRECVKVVKGVEFRASFLEGYFGKTVFLTREEAEARLKELERE